jgi:cobalamin-dependent methionine synthase I
MLRGTGEVCCFGMNLGDEIEATNKVLIEKSIAQGFIWDALCSTLAEYYANRIQIFLVFQYKKKGFRVSRRFSPGYCDLPLMQTQKNIFRFCDMDRIGIQLSSFGLMTPRKSITGMVLAAEDVSLNNPCRICKRNCPHRCTNDETI